MIIGVQIGDTSGCAVYDKGKILYAASEERFTKRKNDSGYPANVIKDVIKKYKIQNDDIEKIVLPSEKITPMHFLCDICVYSISDYIKEQKEYWGPKLIENKQVNYLEVFKEKCKNTIYQDLYEKVINSPESEWAGIWNEWRITKVSKDFCVSKEKVCIINHELSHAAYGLYGSWYENKREIMAVVYDGFGDYSNASIWIQSDGKLQQVYRYNDYNIGRMYRYITLLLGMKPNEHEYKVMGLAPYANEYIYSKPYKIFKNAYKFKDGKVVTDPDLTDNYFYFKDKLEGMRFDGIAAGAQLLTEEMGKQLIKYWLDFTNLKKCVISGGVALNIKANMEIGKMDCVEDLFVVGSSGDESLCIGAIFAYLDKENRGKEIEKLDSLYLGEEVDNEEVLNIIKKIRNSNDYLINEAPTYEEIANTIANGYILGRCSGKMEFGARALGNRSIIADPRKQETINKINKKIKSRDFWMPFTPSILEEEADKYLLNEKGFSYPFMSVACETTRKGIEDLKAAIHPADNTARPQLVSEKMNEGYYNLIKSFKNITGVGALLNTSLNIHGYPIVRTASDAFEVLEKTDLDGLIFDNYLIMKKYNNG